MLTWEDEDDKYYFYVGKRYHQSDLRGVAWWTTSNRNQLELYLPQYNINLHYESIAQAKADMNALALLYDQV